MLFVDLQALKNKDHRVTIVVITFEVTLFVSLQYISLTDGQTAGNTALCIRANGSQ